MNEEQKPWTSIDLYFKGFHIKKSLPMNVKFGKIKKTIDLAIKKGFEPSWNVDTNAKQDPIMKATQDVTRSCPIHNLTMKQSKKGNWYHKEGNQLCVGKGYFPVND